MALHAQGLDAAIPWPLPASLYYAERDLAVAAGCVRCKGASALRVL